MHFNCILNKTHPQLRRQMDVNDLSKRQGCFKIKKIGFSESLKCQMSINISKYD